MIISSFMDEGDTWEIYHLFENEFPLEEDLENLKGVVVAGIADWQSFEGLEFLKDPPEHLRILYIGDLYNVVTFDEEEDQCEGQIIPGIGRYSIEFVNRKDEGFPEGEVEKFSVCRVQPEEEVKSLKRAMSLSHSLLSPCEIYKLPHNFLILKNNPCLTIQFLQDHIRFKLDKKIEFEDQKDPPIKSNHLNSTRHFNSTTKLPKSSPNPQSSFKMRTMTKNPPLSSHPLFIPDQAQRALLKYLHDFLKSSSNPKDS